jgi:hypothetical protein
MTYFTNGETAVLSQCIRAVHPSQVTGAALDTRGKSSVLNASMASCDGGYLPGTFLIVHKVDL